MRIITFLFLFLSFQGFAQCKEYIIGVKGDTLNCVDMKGKKQGRWVIKVDNLRGERGYEEEGVFVNNRKEGMWRRYSLEGDLIALENYRWGNKDGKNIYFNNMGNPLREESWKAVNPDNPIDTVDIFDLNDPTRVVAKQVVKLEGFSLKHGTWKYYDIFSGKLEKTERWNLDKPLVEREDDDLAPIDVTDNGSGNSNQGKVAEKKTVTKPKEVLEFEKKNSGKKKVRVRDGTTF